MKNQMTVSSTPKFNTADTMPYPGDRSLGNSTIYASAEPPTFAWLDTLRINTKISMYTAVKALKEEDAKS